MKIPYTSCDLHSVPTKAVSAVLSLFILPPPTSVWGPLKAILIFLGLLSLLICGLDWAQPLLIAYAAYIMIWVFYEALRYNPG